MLEQAQETSLTTAQELRDQITQTRQVINNALKEVSGLDKMVGRIIEDLGDRKQKLYHENEALESAAEYIKHPNRKPQAILMGELSSIAERGNPYNLENLKRIKEIADEVEKLNSEEPHRNKSLKELEHEMERVGANIAIFDHWITHLEHLGSSLSECWAGGLGASNALQHLALPNGLIAYLNRSSDVATTTT